MRFHKSLRSNVVNKNINSCLYPCEPDRVLPTLWPTADQPPTSSRKRENCPSAAQDASEARSVCDLSASAIAPKGNMADKRGADQTRPPGCKMPQSVVFGV